MSSPELAPLPAEDADPYRLEITRQQQAAAQANPAVQEILEEADEQERYLEANGLIHPDDNSAF
ncbi:MAG TPA: hypothetical protein VHC21_03055 [Candidatus Saccharimonadales bacterium]|nr:hypothetical protein [Candidatus Saccharimonadales bacterium]